MFSCQFWEIFKNTFFIEHPQWLLLPVLKPLDSHRQLCKLISELVTIYFISTFLVLVGIFVFNLASTRFPFTSRRLCAWRNMTFFIFHLTTQLKCYMSFWVGPPHPDSAPYHVLGARGLVNVEIKCFWLNTWPRDRCAMWLCRWGTLILSLPAEFGVHRPCENGNITFFICHLMHRPCDSGDIKFLICHMTTRSMCHVTL